MLFENDHKAMIFYILTWRMYVPFPATKTILPPGPLILTLPNLSPGANKAFIGWRSFGGDMMDVASVIFFVDDRWCGGTYKNSGKQRLTEKVVMCQWKDAVV